MDLVSIIRNQYDAYIDPRAVFGKSTETRLETYDVAGILPTMYACNLEVSDIYGDSLTEYDWEDPLPLLVGKPEIYDGLIDVFSKLVQEGDILPTRDEWRAMLDTERDQRQKKAPTVIT